MNPAPILAAALVLGGCALSPQIVDISPRPDVPDGTSVANANTIGIEVNDARGSREIGSRGGIYRDTATISTAGGMTRSLRNIIAGAFATLGYTVVASGADATLTVDVTELRYNAQGDNNVRKVETVAALATTCRNGGFTQTNNYRVTDAKDVLKAPSGGANEEMINQTLASALERMFNDNRLLECLSR